MSEEKISLIEFGEMKRQMSDVHEIITAGKGCSFGQANRLTMKWVWAAVVSLASLCGAGFVWLAKGGSVQ